MARRKSPPSYRKRKRKQKRSVAEYVASAKNLSSLVPSLRKLAKRKRLSPIEKARITRRERQLKGIPDIFQVTARQAKKLKGQLLFPGVQGIQLRGVTPKAKIAFKGKNLTIEDNGRKWIYWHLSRATVRSKRKFKAAGKQAFQHQFPIELVAELAAEAFKKLNVVQVNLWAHAGIVGDPHHTLNEFVQWVNEKWSAGRYIRTSQFGGDSDPGKWINGIAVLLEDENYARKRAEALEKNKNVLADMDRLGLKAREKERKRLASKGLLDVTGKKLPRKKTKPPRKGKRK